MRAGLAIAAFLVLVCSTTVLKVLRASASSTLETLKSGDIRPIGVAVDEGRGPLKFGDTEPVSIHVTSGDGTVYFAFQLPGDAPAVKTYDQYAKSKVRAAVLAPSGDLFPLDVFSLSHSDKTAYVMIRNHYPSSVRVADIRVECENHAPSTFRISLPQSKRRFDLTEKTQVQIDNAVIEGKGMYLAGNDGTLFPHYGAALRVRGKLDKDMDYEWRDLRVEQPFGPASAGGFGSVSTKAEEGVSLSISISHPFASQIDVVKCEGELWGFPHKTSVEDSGGYLRKDKPVVKIPFQLILPVTPAKPAHDGKLRPGGVVVSNYWP